MLGEANRELAISWPPWIGRVCHRLEQVGTGSSPLDACNLASGGGDFGAPTAARPAETLTARERVGSGVGKRCYARGDDDFGSV